MTRSPFSTLSREAALDRALHLIGITAAVMGSIVLLNSLAAARRPELAAPVALYLVGLFAMLLCSALYNAAVGSPWRPFLRRLDHAAIFLLIAGTYSPFLAGAASEGFVAIAYPGIWTVAIVGMAGKLLLPSPFHSPLFIGLYLALGWSILLVIGPVRAILPPQVLWLIGLGGVLYTVGVGFHLAQRMPYQNAVWHGFVIAGAGLHFLAVLAFVRS